jgi:predicted  nucleic acid-binding Zn-ribbon protein
VNSDVRNLVALQDVEQKIAGLRKQISEIPAKVQSLQDELQHLKQTHEQRMAHSQELAKKRRTYEGEVDMLRSKLSKLKDQLMAVKTNKEYTAMLHEIQAAETQIRSEEDQILEFMEEGEQLDKELKSAEKDLDHRCTEIQNNVQVLEQSVPRLDSEVAQLQQQRQTMESGIEAELLARYRRIADARKGMGLAEAKDELCTACHVRIRPQVYADLRQTDNVYVCDSCSRILYLREAL